MTMLQGRRIAVPESRELDLFAGMLERQGAVAIRCPLVSNHDVEDAAPVQAWLRRLAGGRHDSLVLYTGEGLARLLGFARRSGIEADVIAGLGQTRKIVRGPKPAKVLRSFGLSPDVTAEEPTTAGLIATLSTLNLKGSRIGVQLYPGGEDLLTGFLSEAGAEADPILCYRYTSDEEDEQVVHLVDELAAGAIDLIAFTSTAQVRRLQEVARKFGKMSELDAAMHRMVIAAIGPVTAQAVEQAGWPVGAMPQDSFHLKPMIVALGKRLAQDTKLIPPI
jgi:uroporphyrinogen-III synthase